ncbi:Pr6Pr family membrane protein [Streptomyces sp. NPDC051940]|uniref:Pr6Pr family membrane protein n=1 Tax=Streptomyces sp. NPDC051940 TaxID=3155675 RepID=UPI0034489AB3
MTQSAGKATASRRWHAVLCAVVAAALVLQLVLILTGGADATTGRTVERLSTGTRLVRLVSYFTIESNILVLVAAATLVRRPDRDGRLWRVLRLDALLGIAITGLVYAVVLAPKVHLTGAALWATIGLHYVAPPATLAGWLLFGPRPRIDAATVRRAFVWPVLWIAYTLLHGAVSGWYPYPFLDVAERGYARALLNTALVLLLAAGLALLLAWGDRRLAARDAERGEPGRARGHRRAGVRGRTRSG